MQKLFLYLLLFFFPFSHSSNTKNPVIWNSYSIYENLYTEMNLQEKISYEIFERAMHGHNKIESNKKDIITIIDFTKPSTEERLFVLDLTNKSVLYSSVVSHGKNSGENYAVYFSNATGSHKSSLGFYLTESTYLGKNGYSLVLNGMEKGINDKAKERAIVIHGADYANPSSISSSGRLGRSQGCPALPHSVNKRIIDAIKGGSLLYIHANDTDYLKQSQLSSLLRLA